MNLRAIHEAVKAYKDGASEADVARLDFFEGLYELQAKHADALENAQPNLDVDAAADAYDSSTPLLALCPASIESTQFFGTCRAIADYLATNAGLEEEVADSLKTLDWYKLVNSFDLEQAGSKPPQFVEDCLQNFDDFGIDSNTPATMVMMVVSFALRAHLQDHASNLMRMVPKKTKTAPTHEHPLNCPVCGSAACASHVAMASGIDGRSREMYCSMCGTTWPFERMRCGVCGVENASRLHYFHVEGDSTHRLQNCDECGQYHRIVFEEDLSIPIAMEVEDVVMAKLDKIALDPRFRS